MHELEISSIEKSAIIAVDESGAQYRVEVDETSLARLKRFATASNAQRVSPKEIQSLLRSGLSNDEVMALTGASPEQIERYATPVLAEREYVITTSQTLPAFGHVETTHDAITFGELVAERLELAEVRNREWTAWKSEDGKWMLKLSFTASGVDRDARWVFDGKRATVIPANTEAERLSAAGSFEVPSTPSLRVVPDHISVENCPAPRPKKQSSS
jgi:hypothetical protein